ncbi:MAG: hypothetical protein LBT09_00905 [Planctomycetaceae bacterium]|jgi:hypothetical protein|nr:hypothetical protein [Planctomycetaceae bacterium]
MTFPIPPLKPETESLEMSALSPSSKVFVAATIIFIGSVVAMIHAQIPVASLANLPNEVIDQNLVAAPLPDAIKSDGNNSSNTNELQPELRVALAELKRDSSEPTVALGNVKYTQAYPQPVLNVPNNPQISDANITEPKPLTTSNQKEETIQKSGEQSTNEQKIKSVDFRPMQVPADADNIFGADNRTKIIDSRKTSMPVPTVPPPTEVADSMLQLMQFAENLKSTQQAELTPLAPVDLFQQKNEMVPINHTPSTLVPLVQAKN